jgi:hypothetical protein
VTTCMRRRWVKIDRDRTAGSVTGDPTPSTGGRG